MTCGAAILCLLMNAVAQDKRVDDRIRALTPGSTELRFNSSEAIIAERFRSLISLLKLPRSTGFDKLICPIFKLCPFSYSKTDDANELFMTDLYL
jgi:hypothetical protein